MDMNRFLRTTGIALVAIAAVAALGTLLVRDQISRHQRDLFSPHPLRRLAALGYLGGRPASVDAILLLRDFIAWEPQPMLKKRAMQLLARMEEALDERAIEPEVV
jgi:hypothetical protein